MNAGEASKSECFISVVSVLWNDQDCIEPFLRDVARVLQTHYTDHEIVLVDHGSSDQTLAIVDRLLAEIPWIRLIRLVGSGAEDTAWAAGVENAIGDFVVLMSPNEDPAELIVTGVERCRAGTDIIVGVAENPSPQFRARLRRLGWRIAERLMRHEGSPYATRFHVLSRRAVNAILRSGKQRYRFWLRFPRTGYPIAELPYRRSPRTDRERCVPLTLEVRRGIAVLVFNSMWPLRAASLLGVLGSVGAFLIALYGIFIRVLKQDVVEGWTTLTLFIASMFFLNFLVLACLLEYLSRFLDDRSDQRDYEVLWERHSSVVAEDPRVNVIDESVSPQDNRVQSGRDR
jgi:polyisoprenyl-phosphate glycosyltransferase